MSSYKTKAAAVITAVTTARQLHAMYQDWSERRIDNSRYVITVDNEQDFYWAMLKEISSDSTSRDVRVQRMYGKSEILHNAKSPKPFWRDGIEFSVVVADSKVNSDSDLAYLIPSTATNPITFTTTSPRGPKVIRDWSDEIMKEINKQEKNPHIYVSTEMFWEAKRMSPRTLESIFLPGTEKSDLINDFENFLDSKEDYEAMGLPWHRGYLLYGMPGNGKTSMVRAIAHTYKRDLYTLSLTSLKDDSALIKRVSDIGQDAILLIEDIDVFRATTREKSEGGVTLAGLLNALDGVTTPNGLITFVTTNHKGEIDDALLRPGRLDYHLEFVVPDSAQMSAQFEYVYKEPLGIEPIGFVSMAQFTDVLKRNIGNAEAARLEIKNHG